MANNRSLSPSEAVDEYFDMLIKSRFIEMFEKQKQYAKVPLSDVLNQYYVPEKINHPEKETYITLSSYGKGIKKREIKEGKTPVPFIGCRIKEGQFVSSRLHAKEGAFGIVPRELAGSVVSRDFPVFDINKDLVDENFLITSIIQESFYNQFLNYSFGSTTKRRIKEDVFLDFQITLPPIDVQYQFASFIHLVKKLKVIYKQIFESFDNLVKSRFIEMFGHIHLNEFRNPWANLEDVCLLITDGSHYSPTNDPDGRYPMLSVMDMTEIGFDYSDCKHISQLESLISQ